MGEWEVPDGVSSAQLTHNSLEYIEEREKIETSSEEIKRLDKKSSSDDVSAAKARLKTEKEEHHEGAVGEDLGFLQFAEF